jgi:hypothetical protein
MRYKSNTFQKLPPKAKCGVIIIGELLFMLKSYLKKPLSCTTKEIALRNYYQSFEELLLWVSWRIIVS